jgi:hypothetical protein
MTAQEIVADFLAGTINELEAIALLARPEAGGYSEGEARSILATRATAGQPAVTPTPAPPSMVGLSSGVPVATGTPGAGAQPTGPGFGSPGGTVSPTPVGTGGVVEAIFGPEQPFVSPNALPIDSRAFAQDVQQEVQPFGTFNRFLRSAPGFSEAGGFVQDALRSRFEDIQAQYNLNRVTSPNQSFGDFLNARGGVGRGDPIALRAQLSRLAQLLPLDLTGAIGIDPNQVTAVQAFRDTPSMQRDAALQAVLAEIAPSLRETARRSASRRFTDFSSDFPERQNQYLSAVGGLW